MFRPDSKKSLSACLAAGLQIFSCATVRYCASCIHKLAALMAGSVSYVALYYLQDLEEDSKLLG